VQRGQWQNEPPCTDHDLQQLIRQAPVDLPEEYLAYLRRSNGGGGDIPVQPWLVYFWKALEVQRYNVDYQVAENVPGFYAFGTSGGGEMFAFDTRTDRPWPIVMIPFIVMDVADAVQVAPDFATFSKMLGYCDDKPTGEAVSNSWGS
jgi:hypothetical protein